MEQWLRCRVFKGMFSNERTIVVRVKGNGSVEFIVPQSSVQENNDEGRVRVTVVNRADAKWAVIPTAYRESVPIEEAELVASP